MGEKMNEFTHYGHRTKKDMENCSACILLFSGKEGPNYAAWPLSFLANGRDIPSKYFEALKTELKSENMFYVKNLESKLVGTKYENFILEAKNELGLSDKERWIAYHSNAIETRLDSIKRGLGDGKFQLIQLKKHVSELSKLVKSKKEAV